MTAINTKLVLSALGIALLATPAFAQKPTHHVRPQTTIQSQDPAAPSGVVVTPYPNGSLRSGSAESVESGAEFNE